MKTVVCILILGFAIYYLLGTIFDIMLELTMIHFGFGPYNEVGHFVVVLLWPIIFVWLLGSIMTGIIKGTATAISMWYKQRK